MPASNNTYNTEYLTTYLSAAVTDETEMATVLGGQYTLLGLPDDVPDYLITSH